MIAAVIWLLFVTYYDGSTAILAYAETYDACVGAATQLTDTNIRWSICLDP